MEIPAVQGAALPVPAAKGEAPVVAPEALRSAVACADRYLV